MADTKISDLPSGSPAQSGDELPIARGGANYKLTVGNIGTFSLTSPLAVVGTSLSGAEIRLPEDTDNGSNYVALKSPDILAADLTFTLPNTYGTNGQVLQTNGSGGMTWATVSGGGGVSSVGLTAPTGFSVSNSPITGSGDIALTFSAGYSLPTTSSQSNWDTAYADRFKWDGGASWLDAPTGRTSLGLGTVATQTAPSGTNAQLLANNGSGGFSNVTVGSGLSYSAGTLSATGGGGGGLSWQAAQTTSFTAVAGSGYPCNTTSAAFTVSLPATPSAGALVTLVDYAGTWGTNPLTVSGNGSNINGLLVQATFSTNNSSVQLVYIDSTQGWKAYSYSITPLPQNIELSFLAIAGGGGGGGNIGGGGGAGGYVASTFSAVIGTSYTITVGAGGAGGINGAYGTNGSNSVAFSTTAVGGGGGGYATTGAINGLNGGSGGGAGSLIDTAAPTATGGTATTGQGNRGGNVTGSAAGAGGGGGASAAGGDTSSNTSGAGGAGAASSITGSSVTRAGGGGGGGFPDPGAAGGAGGGGAGGNPTNGAGTAGTANTGSGGGGGAGGAAPGGNGAAGGSGIVIIAYPDTYPAPTTIGAGLTYDQPTRAGFRVYRFTAGTGTIVW
jgi:hypothetical protein